MSSRDSAELRYERAAALLEDFMASTDGETLDDLCAANSDVAAEIRELHGLCRSLGSTRSSVAPSSVLERALSDAFLTRHGDSTAFRRRYRIEGTIAEGGMGTILAAYDEDMHRKIAMKVIRRQARSTSDGSTPPARPAEVARFIREAAIAGMLDHPSIVPVHEVGVDPDGRPYFTMKRVGGSTLRDRLDEGSTARSLPETLALLRIVVRVCEALVHAHERGVIHRDVKPANVMVGELGEVYLMDWGLAKRIDAGATHVVSPAEPGGPLESSSSDFHTLDGRVLGTPVYMSPEQALGAPAAIGPATDVYSVGTVLYHLIARHAPYCEGGVTPSHTRVLERLIQGPPPVDALESAAPELRAICLRAMERDPARRYPTMRMLLADVEAYLSGHVVAAHAVGGWSRAKKWVARNGALTSSLAALLLAILGGLGFSLHLASRETAARLRADAARTESDQRYREMQELTRRMLFDLDDQLLGVPGGLRAREALISTGMEYLDLLLAQNGQDFDLLRHAANGHVRLGRIQQNLGNIAGAEHRMRLSCDILAGLTTRRSLSDSPEDVLLVNELARSESLLGDLLLGQGLPEAALEHFMCANELFGMLCRASPSTDRQAISYASTFGKLGAAHAELGRPWQAASCVAFGIEVLAHLQDYDSPDKVGKTREEARLQLQLGRLHMSVGDTNRALSAFTRAVALVEGSCTSVDVTIGMEDQLGVAWNSMALAANQSGAWTLAVHAFESAHKIFSSLSSERPADTWPRQNLAQNLISWAEGCLHRGEAAAAVEMIRRAREELTTLCALDPANQDWRLDLARSSLSMGEGLLSTGPRTEAIRELERAKEEYQSIAWRDDPPKDARNFLARLEHVQAQAQRLSAELALEHGEKAVERYQAILQQDPTNTVKQNNLAISLNGLGAIWFVRGAMDRALTYCAAATKLARALVEEHSGNQTFLRTLAGCEMALGEVHWQLGDRCSARETWAACLAHFRELQLVDPANDSHPLWVAAAHMALGNTYTELGPLDRAFVEFRSAVETATIELDQHPDSPQWQRLMAKALNQLGEALLLQDQIESAEEVFRRQQGYSFALAEREPNNVEFAWGAAACHRNSAALHMARGFFGLAVDESRQFVEACRQLCKLDPTTALQRGRLGNACRRLGVALRADSQLDCAIESLRESAAILEELVLRQPATFMFRSELVSTLDAQGSLLQELGETQAAESARTRIEELSR